MKLKSKRFIFGKISTPPPLTIFLHISSFNSFFFALLLVLFLITLQVNLISFFILITFDNFYKSYSIIFFSYRDIILLVSVFSFLLHPEYSHIICFSNFLKGKRSVVRDQTGKLYFSSAIICCSSLPFFLGVIISFFYSSSGPNSFK